MANKITYANKTGLIPKTNHINQFWDDDANEIKTVVNANDDRLTEVENVTDSSITNGIKTGGLVTWQSGFIYNVSTCEYILNNSYYNSPDSQVTLTASDPTNPRIDLIVVNTSEQVVVITGTPAASPQQPTPDPLTQIELTSILVTAGSIQPGDVYEEIVYDENTEWTPTASGVVVDFASTTQAYHGSISADVSTIESGDYLKFVNAIDIDLNLKTISFFVWQKAVTTGFHGINIQLFKDSVAVSTKLIQTLSETVSGSWENVTFNADSFEYYDTQFDEVRLTFFGTYTSGVYLDYLKVQRGVAQPSSNNLWKKSGDILTPLSTSDKVLIGTETDAGAYDLQVNESIHIGGRTTDPATPASGVIAWSRSDNADNVYIRNATTLFNVTARGGASSLGTVTTNTIIDVSKQCKSKVTEIGASVDITLSNMEASSRGILLINHVDATAYTITIYGNTDGVGNDYTALTETGSGQIALTTGGSGYVDVLRWEWIFPYLIVTHEIVH